ncbi:unnamed protein product [Discosporangium mesarthrocarpum]
MREAAYGKAVRLCLRSIEGGYDLNPALVAEEGLPFDATQSLRRQMYSRHIRRIDWRCKQRTDEFLAYYRRGERILDIARRPGVSYSPYLLARVLVGVLEPETPVAELMRSPDQIIDSRLRGEVLLCLEEDRDYSPFINKARRTLGSEYEFILQQKLRAREVGFESESDLREKGAYKTPDILLQVPIGVLGPDDQWRLVSWIDSKAMFGDEETFSQEHQSQLLGYVNRYGPGLVIYWFGFVETLLSPSYRDFLEDVMVSSDFPSPLLLPDGQLR